MQLIDQQLGDSEKVKMIKLDPEITHKLTKEIKIRKNIKSPRNAKLNGLIESYAR